MSHFFVKGTVLREGDKVEIGGLSELALTDGEGGKGVDVVFPFGLREGGREGGREEWEQGVSDMRVDHLIKKDSLALKPDPSTPNPFPPSLLPSFSPVER